MLPQRRHQASGGAARAEAVFRPSGRRPPRGRRRHAMAVGALVPPDAARVATRIAKVYTNAPKRHREAVFADLCTLLTVSTSDRATGRRHGSHDVDGPMAPMKPGRLEPEVHAARAVTHPPTRAHEASKISEV